jgi:hypothetical protein
VAHGVFVDSSHTASNFGQLRVVTSRQHTDLQQMKAAGFIEGYLTAGVGVWTGGLKSRQSVEQLQQCQLISSNQSAAHGATCSCHATAALISAVLEGL